MKPFIGRSGPLRWTSSTRHYETGPSSRALPCPPMTSSEIAQQLDLLGVHFIEGGWPGANPRDDEFFKRAAQGELVLDTSELVAFGSTRRPKGKVDDDVTLANLMSADTGICCIVAKSWDYHVLEALRTSLDEGVAMIGDSVSYLVSQGKRVFVDFEHFFDGFKRNEEFALRAAEAAAVNGAEVLVLCDTNGGSLPHEVEGIYSPPCRDVWVRCHHWHAHSERHRLRRGQRGGGRPGRGDPCAGHHQWLWRAHRQL